MTNAPERYAFLKTTGEGEGLDSLRKMLSARFAMEPRRPAFRCNRSERRHWSVSKRRGMSGLCFMPVEQEAIPIAALNSPYGTFPPQKPIIHACYRSVTCSQVPSTDTNVSCHKEKGS